MKIVNFDRKNLKEVRAAIDAALVTALADFGLTAKLGNISFLESEFSSKLTVSIGGADDAERNQFEKYAGAFNVSNDKYQAVFPHNGRMFTLIGFKPRSPKYPIIAMTEGKRYKLPLEAIANL